MLGPAEHFFRVLRTSYVRFYIISLRWCEIISHELFTRLHQPEKLHPTAPLQRLRAGLDTKTQNTIPSHATCFRDVLFKTVREEIMTAGEDIKSK
jgi:hypothetical protein